MVWCVENDMILLIIKEVVVHKNNVFELLAMETRGELSTERSNEEIYPVVCVGTGVANLSCFVSLRVDLPVVGTV